MYIVIILKTIFLYLFIMVGFRIMGKKEVGQLNVIDLIVSILIAELAALSLETAEQSLLKSIVPITTLILIQISLSYWSLKDSKVRTILEGRPTVIIKDGKLNFSAMAKIRYSLDDLILQLREKGYQSIEEVSFVPATLLPKGWTWKRYYDGSGCLLSPEQKEFMIYDLETNEYKFDKDSDYDFYIVVPDDAGNKLELSQKAYKSLRGIRRRPVDIVVGYESSFDERSKENTLEKVVKQEGVLLYEK